MTDTELLTFSQAATQQALALVEHWRLAYEQQRASAERARTALQMALLFCDPKDTVSFVQGGWLDMAAMCVPEPSRPVDRSKPDDDERRAGDFGSDLSR